MAPAYDVSMHLHSPENNGQFALLIHSIGSFDDLGRDDLVAEGVSWGLPPARADQAVAETLDALAGALAAERATGDHPGVGEPAWSMVEERVASLGGDQSGAPESVMQFDLSLDEPPIQPGSDGWVRPHLRSGRPVPGHKRRPGER